MNDFNSWFNEVENFSFRSERFYGDLADYQDGDQDRIIKWLRAAYQVGRQHEADYRSNLNRNDDSGFSPPFDPYL